MSNLGKSFLIIGGKVVKGNFFNFDYNRNQIMHNKTKIGHAYLKVRSLWFGKS